MGTRGPGQETESHPRWDGDLSTDNSDFGILQIPARCDQGRQFYCRRVYEPKRRLGGESAAHSLQGPPRKGPARVSTGPPLAAQSSPAARSGGWCGRLLCAPPQPVETQLPGHLPAPDPRRPGVREWGRRRRGTRGSGPAWGAGPRPGAQIGSRALGPRQLRSRAQRAAGPPQPGRP